MALSTLDPTFLGLRGYISCIREKLQKKAPSVPHEYSEESLESCSGLATAVASAIFGEKKYCKQLKLPLALSKQGGAHRQAFCTEYTTSSHEYMLKRSWL